MYPRLHLHQKTLYNGDFSLITLFLIAFHLLLGLSLHPLEIHIEKYIVHKTLTTNLPNFHWLSPRPISTGHLNTLLHLQLQPIKHVCLHVVLLD